MRIHLDTHDLIDLIERGRAATTPDNFQALLLQGHHTLVLSFPLICEIAEPLWDPNSTTSVTRTLRRLEAFPHEWMDTGHLPDLEVQAAMESYRAGQPYASVDAYVRNFLETLENPPREALLMINYTLPEIVFDLWRSGNFDPRAQKQRHVASYRELLKQERQLLQRLGNRLEARRALFIQRLVELMQRVRLNGPGYTEDVERLRQIGEMAYQNPSWCPSRRLVFETFHSLVEDLGDQLEDGDLGDFFNVQTLPYVDLFTTDKRIAAHIDRVDRRLGLTYASRVRRNVLDLIDDIS